VTPVLIAGETGTGKSALARAIHAAGARASASFGEKVVQLGSRAQRGGSESRGAIIFVRGVRCSWKREPTWNQRVRVRGLGAVRLWHHSERLGGGGQCLQPGLHTILVTRLQPHVHQAVPKGTIALGSVEHLWVQLLDK
jgi:hypothetical protein